MPTMSVSFGPLGKVASFPALAASNCTRSSPAHGSLCWAHERSGLTLAILLRRPIDFLAVRLRSRNTDHMSQVSRMHPQHRLFTDEPLLRVLHHRTRRVAAVTLLRHSGLAESLRLVHISRGLMINSSFSIFPMGKVGGGKCVLAS
jgi:hypothetical protein